MNTQFLTEFKIAIVALLAVLNSTNSPVKQSEPVAVLGMTFTNLVFTNSIELLVYTNVAIPSPLDGPSKEKWPTLAVTTNEWQIPIGGLRTNYLTLTTKTNWITYAEIRALVKSGQVCRVMGTHSWVYRLDAPPLCGWCGEVFPAMILQNDIILKDTR